MSVGLLSICAPSGLELNGAVESVLVVSPARSAGVGFDGRAPGTGAAVQTFSGGFFVCGQATPGRKPMASIMIAKRMGSASLFGPNAALAAWLSTDFRFVRWRVPSSTV